MSQWANPPFLSLLKSYSQFIVHSWQSPAFWQVHFSPARAVCSSASTTYSYWSDCIAGAGREVLSFPQLGCCTLQLQPKKSQFCLPLQHCLHAISPLKLPLYYLSLQRLRKTSQSLPDRIRFRRYALPPLPHGSSAPLFCSAATFIQLQT